VVQCFVLKCYHLKNALKQAFISDMHVFMPYGAMFHSRRPMFGSVPKQAFICDAHVFMLPQCNVM
jgi:hypothetical protein